MSTVNYVKNYDVGNLRLDTPYAHFIYELPLLSFGDVLHTVGLSLVFNSRLIGTNAFYMSNGYKLNLQKRIILSDGGTPVSFEEGNGTTITLNPTNEKYVFDDKSGRILRKLGNTYRLDYADYSYEFYDNLGRISYATDKYGEQYLTYSYMSGKLSSVTYRSNKVIVFEYNSLGTLCSIEYKHNSVSVCKSTLSYNGSSHAIVSHYSGVTYYTSYSGDVFTSYSADSGSVYSNEYSHEITCKKETNKMTVKKRVGSTTVDETIYEFINWHEANKYCVLDVTDFNGIKTRIQFENDVPCYSYEIVNNMFLDDTDESDSYYPGIVKHIKSKSAIGALRYNDGIKMVCETDTHNTDYNRFTVAQELSGRFILSGWLKPIGDLSSCNILIFNGDQQVNAMPINCLKKDVWTYFSIDLELENYESLHALTEVMDDGIKARDFRLIYYSVLPTDASYMDHLIKNIDMLFEESTGISYEINENLTIYCGDSVFNYKLTPKDILRYKINKMYGENKNEILYDDCRRMTSSSEELYVKWSENERHYLTDLAVGQRHFINRTSYVTRTNFYDEDNDGVLRLRTKSVKDGVVFKSQTFDEKLDLLDTKDEQIITYYERKEGTGLVNAVRTMDLSGGTTISRSSLYDDTNTALMQTIDEFGTATTYTTDSTWGVITKATVMHTDDTTGLTSVTDTFDNDCDAQMSRSFADEIGDEGDKTHTFAYGGGMLNRINSGTLSYSFEYAGGTLSSVQKNNSPLEQILLSDDRKTITNYYPDDENTRYTAVQEYDSYGRIKRIEGQVAYTYDLNPYFDTQSLIHRVLGIDNGSSKLASDTDLITGNVTRYAYENDRLWLLDIFNSSGETVGAESYEYDEANRLTANVCGTSAVPAKPVRTEIEYVKDTTDPTIDSAVKKYIQKVNNTVVSVTENTYDGFKRFATKSSAIGINPFVKSYSYNASRAIGVSETISSTNVGANSLTYDTHGRIVSDTYTSAYASDYKQYEYDSFGQLVRENNQALDKTFVYCYDNIGNISKVKTYGYTTGDLTELSCTEQNYSYHQTYVDRLTAFGTKAITYDSLGRPTSVGDENYVWTKDKLTRIYSGSSNTPGSKYVHCNFTYDGHGRRIAKNYSYDPNISATNDYYYAYDTTYDYDQSGRLIREYCKQSYTYGSDSTREFVFLYDESGIIGVMYSYNGATPQPYYYRRNLQGDVIAIYDANGTRTVEYAYDAFGKCTVKYSTISDLAYNNPIRYRGYYFDHETGLYYLNARYYNPQWRRFISPDDTAYLDPESVNGLNLYVYCNNDPVNNIDPSGHEWYNPLTWDWGEIVKGVGLIITGVGAIAVGIVTLPYGGWISAVAGITILAGGGTALFGLSDVGEGITDYNVIQEAVFMGNENAYNLTENIFMYTAIAGTAICGLYGATHTTFSSARSTPRTGNPHSGYYNRKFNTLTYYGKNGEMKYSMHLFDKGHQWIHWHTELPHSKPINNFLAFVWEMLSGGV